MNRRARALLFLIRLNLRGKLRKTRASFRGIKGLVMLLVFGGFVALMVFSQFQSSGGDEAAAGPRRSGALLLLVYTVLSAFGGMRTRGIYFSAAEIEFLFPAPFHRRDLVAYRLADNLIRLPFVSLIFAVFLLRHSTSFWTAWAGSVLVFALVSLVQLNVAVGAAAASERIARVGNRLAFVGGILGVFVLLGILQARTSVASGDVLAAFTESAAGRVILAPFEVFTKVFICERLIPDALLRGAGALGILAGLGLCLFLLDIDYREAAVETSRRVGARLKAVRRSGQPMPALRHLRFRIPPFPRWGGIGPLAWRQSLEALRNAPTVLFFLVIFAAIFIPSVGQGGGAMGGIMAFIIVLLPQRLTFDFRGDYERMEILKAAPVSSLVMTAGQILVPAAIITVIMLLGFGAFSLLAEGGTRTAALLGLAFSPAVAVLVVGVENLMFLLYPAGSRVMPGDVGAFARNLFSMLLKFLCLLVVGGAAFGVGYGAYEAAGGSIAAGAAAAWLVAALGAFTALAACARAFERFDVSREGGP